MSDALCARNSGERKENESAPVVPGAAVVKVETALTGALKAFCSSPPRFDSALEVPKLAVAR